MSQTIEIKVPDVGGHSDLPVIEVLVSEGEYVEAEQALVTLESDKATIDVPCPQAGVVQSLNVKSGDKVSEGTVLLVLVEKKFTNSIPDMMTQSDANEASENILKKFEHSHDQSKKIQINQSDESESSLIKVSLPDIGTLDSLPVVEIFAKVGDTIRIDDPILSLESEKSTIDVPSIHEGIVKEITVKVGERIAKGKTIAIFAKSCSGDTIKQEVCVPSHNSEDSEEIDASKSSTALVVHASPSVRKLARELGIDLRKIKGSGPRGRVLHEDVHSYLKKSSVCYEERAYNKSGSRESHFPDILPWPEVDFKKFGPCRREPLSRIQNISGANLHRNWISIPHVTAHDDVDITDLENFRVEKNKYIALSGGKVKLTTLAFIIKISAFALKQFPVFNSSLVGKELIFKEYFNIGFATDTENGLVVPVIRAVDKKGILDIAKEIADLAKRARDGQLKAEDMQGGCFSISSLGGIGGRYFSPIINAPEVAIIGVGRGTYRPVYIDGELRKRFMLPLSLSYDHRVIDGATAARFHKYLSELLSDLRGCLL